MTLINANLMPPTEKNKYVTIYSHNDESISKFRNDIIDKRIFNQLNKDLHSNPNANYNLLESEIVHSMNSHLGIKIVKFNKKKHKRDPWITYGILKSVNQKNLLFKRMKKTNVESPLYDDRKQQFNSYKNLLRRLINQAKTLYYGTEFNRHRGNGKKTWRTLDNALHRKTKRTTPDAMLIKEEICTNKTDIADAFNDYFATISSNNHVQPNDTPSYKNYLNAPTDTSFSFQPIDNTVTLQLLSKLTATHSCGHDNISSTVLKYISKEISECITLIVNQSIVTGIYPDKLKVAKVVPIFKKEDKLQLKNYRPISVLPVISKIFENVMLTQLVEYFTTNNLLSSQQYGFRSNRSTDLAALELMDRNIKNMNDNLWPVNIYLDFSKAFDSLNHIILLSKLKFYGIQQDALCLLKSYLTNRSQYVQLDNVKSSHHTVLCGIPQGSVLGPLIFNIFINDIIKASSKFDFILYADDTTLVSTLENFGTLNNVAELENAINCEISKISSWLVSNMLVLNVAKSKLMLFFKSPKRPPKLTLTINGDIIEQVEEFNFLGITVDQNVNWDAHITKISIKLARVIGILHKLKRTFPQHILRTIYNSLIHPHFVYGLYLWGLKCRRIKVLQKKAVRILAFKPYVSHSTPIFKILQILKIEDLYTIQLYKLYYKLRNNLLPSYFHSFIPYYHNDQHTHDLRYTIFPTSYDKTRILC